MTLFLSKLERALVSIDLAPQGDGTRTVCVWTWPDGPEPVQAKPFQVPSLEDARALLPQTALRVVNAPEWFAEEVWFNGGELCASTGS